MSPYYNLANAIIVQAVKDYRKALRHYNRDPQKDKSANEVSMMPSSIARTMSHSGGPI